MKNLIMVVTHKKYKTPSFSPYKTIIVGNSNLELKNAWHDNQNENISNKNPYYCELTALYWVWKNKTQSYHNIGLCHYRRIFTKNRFSNHSRYFLSDKDIDKVMKNFDVILPYKFYWKNSVAKQYYKIGQGRKKDLELTQNAIQSLYPEYLKSFHAILSGHCASYCNMFIMSNTQMCSYCEWLFSILEYVERRIDMTGYSIQEQRVFGYLSEILLNVWIEKNKLKIKYYPVTYLEYSKIQQMRETLSYSIRKLHYTILKQNTK